MLYNNVEIDLMRLSRNYLVEPLISGEYLPKEELHYLFIECNLTCTEIYEFTGKYHNKLIKKLGIEKSKEQKQIANKRYIDAKYNGVHYSQRPDVIEKRNKTNKEKYGCENPFGNKEIQKQIKQTNLDKYGCENPSNTEYVKNKKKVNTLRKYGVEHTTQIKEVKAKMQQTFIKNYGVECGLLAEEVKNKIKETNLKKYGCEYSISSKVVQEKIKKTNLEKHGYEFPFCNEDIQKSLPKIWMKKYGCENPMQNKDIQEKSRKTNLEKYGCESYTQVHISPESLRIIKDKNLFEEFLRIQKRTTYQISKALGISRDLVRSHAHKYDLWDLIDHCESSYELEIQELFPNVFFKTRSVIYPYEIDLYDEKLKFGIEFNGNYWHSEQHGIPNDYHQKKSLFAEEKGIFLYHIWEYEWLSERKRSIIISQLNNILGLNENRIYARKCVIRSTDSKEARQFLDENHIQGYCSSKINIGLYHENSLVSLMTFGKPRFKSDCEYELIRYCNKKNTSVIGGASKLFKEFVKEFNPQSILSYSHIDKGTGKLYNKLGFKLDHISDPDYVWVKEDSVLSRYQCQKHKLLAQGFKGNSETEIMEKRGYKRIFGCGNKIWKWTLKSNDYLK